MLATNKSKISVSLGHAEQQDCRCAPGLPERFGVIRVLGQGGMETVYLAKDKTVNLELAVEVLSDPLPDATALDRFAREAAAASELLHPNIAQVFDFSTAGELKSLLACLFGSFPLCQITGYFGKSDVLAFIKQSCNQHASASLIRTYQKSPRFRWGNPLIAVHGSVLVVPVTDSPCSSVSEPSAEGI